MSQKEKNSGFSVYREELKDQFTSHWDFDYLNSEELGQLHLTQGNTSEGGSADSRSGDPIFNNRFTRLFEIVKTAIVR